jgi:hypothetical protein
LYVEGRDEIPATVKSTNGVPSVDAIAMPPAFAVKSVETSTPSFDVVRPITISLSSTVSSFTLIKAVVPPIVIFPVTFKLR